MASRRRMNTTPDSGYKFNCQSCGSDVYQVPPPELVMALVEEGSGRNKIMRTEPIQCCEDCAIDVKAENAKIQKKLKRPDRQVVPLRESQQLAAVIPDVATIQSSSDAKLDKVLDALAALTQLLVAQAQAQQPAPPPVQEHAESETPKPKVGRKAPDKARPRLRVKGK